MMPDTETQAVETDVTEAPVTQETPTNYWSDVEDEPVASAPEESSEPIATEPEPVEEVLEEKLPVVEQPPEPIKSPESVTPPEPQVATPPQPATLSQEEILARRTALVDQLATEAFRLPEEVTEAIGAPVATSLSKLAAEAHVISTQSIMQAVLQVLPSAIKHVLETQNVEATHEKRFFDSFPAIDRDKHGQFVAQMASLYRQANPNASVDEVIKIIGATTMQHFGLKEASAAIETPKPAVVPAAAPKVRPSAKASPVPAKNGAINWAEVFADD